MRDPYDVLGVSKSASAADIKSAFRKLAKKLHPDANKHDPKAATRFAELNAAYEILGEDDKRKAFDRGEIDAEGKPRFQGFEGFGRGPAGGFGGDGNFETFSFGRDGFQRSAGGRTGDVLITVAVAPHPLFAREGADLRLELPITLYEATLGGKVRVPTLVGAVELAIPPGTNSGRTFRLKGKGFPAKAGAGDL